MALPLQAPNSPFEGLGDFYAQQRQQAALMAAKQREEHERIRQFNENLKLAQSQENRAQQKLPFELQQFKDIHSTSMLNNLINQRAMKRADEEFQYRIQEYKDAHEGKISVNKLNDIRNKVTIEAYKRQYEKDLADNKERELNQGYTLGSGPVPQNIASSFNDLPDKNRSMLRQFIQSGQVSPEDIQKIQAFMGGVTPEMNRIPLSPESPMPDMVIPQINAPQQVQGGQPVTQAPQSEEIGKEILISPGDPDMAYKNIEGKTSEEIKNGYLIKKYPDNKVTATKIPAGMAAGGKAMSLQEKIDFEKQKADIKLKNEKDIADYRAKLEGTPFQKEITKKDADNLSDLNKNLYVAREIQPSINYMRTLSNSPEMQVIKQNPYLFGKDVTYFKKSNEHKAEAGILGEMSSVQKTMYADMAQKFKGAFRAGEQKLFSELLPSDSDTIEVMLGKIQGMDLLNRAVIQRLSMVDDLVRNPDNKMTINHAMEQADKAFPIDELRNQVKQEYGAKVYSTNPTIQAFAVDAIKRGAKESDVINEIAKMQGANNVK